MNTEPSGKPLNNGIVPEVHFNVFSPVLVRTSLLPLESVTVTVLVSGVEGDDDEDKSAALLYLLQYTLSHMYIQLDKTVAVIYYNNVQILTKEVDFMQQSVIAHQKQFAVGDVSFTVSRLQVREKENIEVWFQKMHYHSFYEMHYLLCGSMICDRGHRRQNIPPHSVCIIPPAVKHRFIPCSADAKRLSFYISFERIAGEPEGIYDRVVAALGSAKSDLIKDKQIESYFEQLVKTNIWSQNPVKYLEAQALLQLIVLRIAALCAPSGTAASKNRSGDLRDMASSLVIEHYIWKNYGTPVTVKDAAEYCGISVRSLERVCDRSFGKTFTELLRDYRMDTARNLMLTTDLDLGEIARITGYSSYDGFYKAWVKHFGVSPSELTRM